MTDYLGGLSHGLHTIVVRRDGKRIRWLTSSATPGVIVRHCTPAQAHDAIEAWIRTVTGDWTEQAELRRRALDIRYRIDNKELDQ